MVDTQKKIITNLEIGKYLLPTIKSIVEQRNINQIHSWRENMSFAYLDNKDKINTELLEFNRLHTINTILKAKNTCNCDKNHLCPIQYTHNK